MDPRQRAVWVLGAGFSRSLGGPLLSDLFSDRLFRDLSIRYQTNRFLDEMIRAVRTLYGEETLASGGDRPWKDAEEFLDFIDRIDPGDPDPYLVSRLVPYGLIEDDLSLLRWPKLVLAAACSQFLSKDTVYTERWMPYVRWAQSLGPNDLVLSFNYDQIPELLNSQKLSQFNIITPDINGGVQLKEDDLWKGVPKVLKLHGSVGWEITKSGVIFHGPMEDPMQYKGQVLIATPGDSKRAVVNSKLKELWELSRVALQETDAIVFLGYRFPETDAEARRLILEAIVESSKSQLEIYTVLGPDLVGRDAARLHGLLQFSRRRAVRTSIEIRPHPLFVEDYLTLVERKRAVL